MKTPPPRPATGSQPAQPQTLTPTAARRTARHGFKLGRTTALAGLAALLGLFAAPAAQALTWDTVSGDSGTITDGSGAWNTTAGNLVWNNAGANPNVIWSQTSGTVGTQTAVFGTVGGTDGTVDQWTVTLGAAMADTSTTFNITGYKITGSTLTVSGNGAITVASGKTSTINSTLGLATSATATHVINGTLNLGGGTSGTGNNIVWNGGGTINLNAGTYALSNQRFDVPAWNQTGGTVNLTVSSASGSWIGYQGTAKNVNMTVSGGTFNVNGSGASGSLGIGRNWGFDSILTVKTGGAVNVGISTDASLVLNADGAAKNAQLDVQGGNLTVGTGAAGNAIVFFAGSANASKIALMTQSGGTVTANGIRFGGAAGTIDPTALATLQLSGGNLYVGTLGIIKGAGAATLNSLIQLQGGILGADQDWSSSLDMKLGTTGGGPTIQAATAASVSKNISLSGILSNDGAVNGTLTKTGAGTLTLSGANSYSGDTTISAGTLKLDAGGTLANTPNITVASGAGFDVSTPTTALTLGSSQTLKASATGATTTGTITVASGNNLTLGGTSTGLEFTAYGGGSTAPLTVTGAGGSLDLNGKPIKITTTAVLGAGPYKLIAKSGSATVTGTPGTLVVAGSGLASGATATLSVIGGELFLTLSYSVTYDGNTSDGGTAPAAQNGDYGTSITAAANTFTKTGNAFFAWNTAANGSGTTVPAGASYTIPASNTTFYAQWTVATVPTKLVVTVVPSGTTPAGNTFSVNVQAQDNSGNPGQVTQNTGISLAASGAGTLAGNTATIPAGSSVVTLSGVTYTKAEAITLTASRTSGDALATSVASSAFTVSPNVANVANSSAVASPTSLAANGSAASTVTVTLKDAYNNLLGAGTNVTWSVTGTGNSVSPASSGTTDGSGVASFTVKSVKAEAKTVTVNVGATVITSSLVITFTTPGSPNVLTWDPANNTTGSDAAGTWSTTAANWANNSADFAWPNNGNDSAVFGSGAALGANYAVTMGTPVTVGNLTFNTTGANQYTLGNEQTITLAGTPAISVAGAATIANDLAGTGFSKTGAGTLTLSGASTYTGNTTIGTGTLQLGAGGTAGRLTATTSIINNGNLTINRSSAFSQATDLGAGAAISGSGSVTHAGTSTVTLTANNSYDGTTTINSTGASGSPQLNVSHNNALGSTVGGTIVYGSNTTGDGSKVNLADGITVTDETLTLDATANGYRATLITSGTATWDGNVVLNGTSGLTVFNANGASANLTVGSSAADTVTGNRGLFIRGAGSGTINSSIQIGANGVSKADAGTWTLTGNNTYSGSTAIGSGTLQLGDGTSGHDGTIANSLSVALNGTTTKLVYNRFGSTSYGGVISGSGTVTMSGTGTQTLTGVNTYTGGTTISGGTLQLGDGTSGNDGTIAGSPGVTNNAALVYNRFGSSSYGGVISGTGTVTKSGPGAQTLSGANTYSGPTTISAGELIGNTAGSCANSAVTVASGATNGVQLAAADATWTCGGLTYSAGTTYADFDFTATAPSTTVAPLNIGGNLAVNSTVNVIARRGSALTAGTSYPLITWSGSGPANLNGFGTVTLPAAMPGTLALNTGTKTISVVAGIKVPNLNYTNASGTGRQISLADITAAGLASSQGSPTYTISLPSGTSAGGGSVITDGSRILYTPSGAPSSDSFSYTVTDGTATATATVMITFGSVAGAQIDSSLIGNDGADHARFTFHGIPNTPYHVQRATVLSPTPNWTNADAGVTSGNDGSYLWTDTATITSLGGSVYYRISYP